MTKRFLDAQNAGSSSAYDRALTELRLGRKRSHWIWFVLPQLRGLGHSATAQQYGVNDLAEAKAYLDDATLCSRLEEVIAVIADQLQKPDQSLERLMGGELDATKTISSLTLFAAAGLNSAEALLKQLGRRCSKTQALLNAPGAPPLA